ncbi:MAG: hypothetical protein AB1758_28495, partial [Candidatus Eremiobacterota bacterium]
ALGRLFVRAGTGLVPASFRSSVRAVLPWLYAGGLAVGLLATEMWRSAGGLDPGTPIRLAAWVPGVAGAFLAPSR